MKNTGFSLLALLLFVFTSDGQIIRQWASTWNGQGDYNSRFSCVKADASGNIYAAGHTVNPDQGRDYLIRKYSSTGNILWSKEFAGDAGGADDITSLFISDSGNVYVTGFMKFNDSGTDYFTIKMNSNGDTLWTARYNNAATYGFDQANDLFVDAAGNVYVTGQSDSDPTSLINDDYLTVKYNAAGIRQWEARYNGTGNAIDRPARVMADASGNVYVTGRTDNGNNDDYLTIKYNSVGTRVWMMAGNRVSRDRATAMAMDASGNIYITGRSSNGNDDDYWTLKYSSAGLQLWQIAYDYVGNDRPTNIVVDAGGNVIVTGQSDADATAITNWDITTVGYNTTGAQLWVQRYNGAANLDDIPSDLSAGSSTAVVTGYSLSSLTTGHIATIGYNVSGGSVAFNRLFTLSQSIDTPMAVCVSGSSCFVAGSTYTSSGFRNALLVSVDRSSGNVNWQRTAAAVGNNNENIREILPDNSGNLLAVGYSVRNERDRDLAFWKFSAAGNLSCSDFIDGTVNESSDDASGLVLDNAGNPVVCGYLENAGQSNDIWYSALTTFCDTAWTRSYNGSANRSDKSYDMTRDASGNLYITGRTDMDPTYVANPDCFTAKVGPTGVLVWYRTYNVGGTNEDRGSFVRLGATGNVYVVGRTFNGTNLDILILAYDNTGTLLWSRVIDRGGNDVPSAAVLGPGDRIFFTGRTETTPGTEVYDFYTVCYSSTGSVIWSDIYDGTGSGNDESQAIAFVPLRDGPVISGKSDRDASAGENMDMVTIQYDANGNRVWTNVFGGNAQSDDIPDALAVKPNSQVYLVGHTNTSTALLPNYDLYFAAINPYNGNTIYSDLYNGVADSSDIPNTIVLRNNDIFIAGSCFAPNQQRNILVLKYAGSVDGIDENLPGESVFRFYPIPATDRLDFRSDIVLPDDASLSVSDITGKTLLQHDLNRSSEATLPLTGLAAGSYTVVLSADGKVLFRKKFLHLSVK